MATREMRTELFGRETRFEYSETWVGYSLLLLRVVMGWIFFQAGLDKVLEGNWTAAGYLNNVPADNPFRSFFTGLAGNGLVDLMNMWGLTLVGLALLLGVLVRFSAFWGAIIMLFYWASSLEGGLLAGLPIAHGWVVNDHMVYAALLFGLGAFGAGRILGLDKYIEETAFVQNNRWARYLLG